MKLLAVNRSVDVFSLFLTAIVNFRGFYEVLICRI